jgi:3-deoxy-manno-octulosonate cytidylyltransferase (CMP-KDO synthetase)
LTDFRIVIPARYASTRLPGKPLLPIAGRPMIEHVYDRARRSGALSVLVATDDERIAEAVAGFGGDCCMTSGQHPSGTDRLAEVARLRGWRPDDILVNLQGDEPLMPSELLTQVAEDLAAHDTASVATVAAGLEFADQVFDANLVKVVTDAQGFALYFSRAPIPWNRDAFAAGGALDANDYSVMRRHIGLYAYRVAFLRDYVGWPPAPIERAEALEQLRALWNGHRIHVIETDRAPPAGVDTAEDLDRVERVLTN